VRWRWPWRRADDTTDEARACLQQLDDNDAEVRRLADELRIVKRRNNFSAMVDAAITRRARREGA
jgi:hypothetical protein